MEKTREVGYSAVPGAQIGPRRGDPSIWDAGFGCLPCICCPCGLAQDIWAVTLPLTLREIWQNTKGPTSDYR